MQVVGDVDDGGREEGIVMALPSPVAEAVAESAVHVSRVDGVFHAIILTDPAVMPEKKKRWKREIR